MAQASGTDMEIGDGADGDHSGENGSRRTSVRTCRGLPAARWNL